MKKYEYISLVMLSSAIITLLFVLLITTNNTKEYEKELNFARKENIALEKRIIKAKKECLNLEKQNANLSSACFHFCIRYDPETYNCPEICSPAMRGDNMGAMRPAKGGN